MDHLNRSGIARQRLVKEVRANCLAPWLANQFPDVPLILVVRHPLSVVASRILLGWKDQLAPLVACAELVRDHLADRHDDLDSLEDPLARMAAQWSIETVVPLRMLAPGRALFIGYESMRRHPAREGSRILRYLGQPADAELERMSARPSRTARERGRSSSPNRNSWSGVLDEDQVRRAWAVIESFGFAEFYSPSSSVPLRDMGESGAAAL